MILGLSQDPLHNFTVATEISGGCELTQLVTNHRLVTKNLDKFLTLMNQESVANKIRRDHTGSAPGFDGSFITGLFLLEHLAQQLRINVWSFFTAA